MTNDNTNWTPSSEDNLLGLIDKNEINEHEAKGIAAAELYIFNIDEDIKISTSLILEIHKTAFGELYDWAGKWRTKVVNVGFLEPPAPSKIPNLIYQFIDNLNFKIANATTRTEHIDVLAFGHYQYVYIHPFNNGNGRTGRLLMNLIALKFGYQPLELYFREGEGRKIYIEALRKADEGNMQLLKELIEKELVIL